MGHCEFSSLEEKDILDLIDFIGTQERGDIIFGKRKDEIVTSVQSKGFLSVDTLEGVEKLFVGELLIKGVDGEFYPVKKENFLKVYKQIEKE